jgi:hypothetical protein
MPRKYTRRVTAETGTPARKDRCPTCGKWLAAEGLEFFDEIIRSAIALIDEPIEETEPHRHRRALALRLGSVRNQLSVLADEQRFICKGHEPVKRGPRKKGDLPPIELTSQPPKLRTV